MNVSDRTSEVSYYKFIPFVLTKETTNFITENAIMLRIVSVATEHCSDSFLI